MREIDVGNDKAIDDEAKLHAALEQASKTLKADEEAEKNLNTTGRLDAIGRLRTLRPKVV